MEVTACQGKLMPEEELTSLNVCDGYLLLCKSCIVNDVTK